MAKLAVFAAAAASATRGGLTAEILVSILMFLIMNVRLMTKSDTRVIPHPDAPIGLARRLYQIALGAVAEVHANTDLRPLEFGS